MNFASAFFVAAIVAAEVDQRQHAANSARAPVPKVDFQSFGAEAIAAEDAAFDLVLMFKSLHHVPVDLLDQALTELHRVLKPGGLAYISEPVFAGAFNDVLRLFHDEQAVRAAAFAAVGRAIERGLFELVEERFFLTEMVLEDFGQFERRVMQATHTDHNIDRAMHDRVRARFEAQRSASGYRFEIPNRVDLLRRR